MDLFNRKKIKELEKKIEGQRRDLDIIHAEIKAFDEAIVVLNRENRKEKIILQSGSSVKIFEDSILWHIVGELNALYNYLHIEAKVVYVEDEYYKALHPVPRVKTIKIVKKGKNGGQK